MDITKLKKALKGMAGWMLRGFGQLVFVILFALAHGLVIWLLFYLFFLFCHITHVSVEKAGMALGCGLIAIMGGHLLFLTGKAIVTNFKKYYNS